MIAGQGFGQQHQLRAVLDAEFAADDQFEVGGFRGLQCAHDAGHAAFVGDGQGGITLLPGAFEQFPGIRSAALETEVRKAMELGIGGQGVHANHPCSMNGPACSPAMRNAHARCPCAVSTR